MKGITQLELSLPELILIAGSRAILGGGIALLFANKLTAEQRKLVGWTLFSIGALASIPLAFETLNSPRFTRSRYEPPLRLLENEAVAS